MRHKKVGLGLALLVLLLSAVLGATVLREPIAYAASATPFQNVIVMNTDAQPVPVEQQGTANVDVTNADASGNIKVHEQGTASVQAVDRTQLVLARAFGENAENTVDVSAYREIRVYANVNNCAQPATVWIKSLGGSPQVLDTFTVGCLDVSKTYEVPGQRLLFEWHEGPGQLFVFGRAN
jgi:hypothetical protein